MKSEKTPLSNTEVFRSDGNIFRVILPFTDGSSLNFFVKLIGEEIRPVNSADSFIYKSVSQDIRDKIKKLCIKYS